MKQLRKLYLVFFELGLFTFGGGYAMLSLLEKVVVEKYHWASEEELMDYYAIGQCTPGIIAINTSTFIGYKIAGISGAIMATLGFLSPSIIIITVIAAFMRTYASIPLVSYAFSGIRICVCVLILDAVIKLGKKSLKDQLSWGIFLLIILLSLGTDLSTIWLIVIAGCLSYCFDRVKGVKDK